MPASKECWLDARATNRDEVTAAFNAPLDALVVSPEQVGNYEYPASMSVVVEVSSPDDLRGCDDLQRVDVVVTDDSEWLADDDERPFEVAYEIDRDAADVVDQIEDTGFVDEIDYLVLPEGAERASASERLLDAARSRGLSVLDTVVSVDEARAAFARMNGHAGGVIISSDSRAGASEFVEATRETTAESVSLEPFEVASVEQIGRGTRCCVDVASLMDTSDGMLVGSTSAGGLFVCSESHSPPNMTPRPFRVNAGAVHSYVWTDADEWDYLTELAAGDPVACVDVDGTVRTAHVGRVLVAERPLVLVTASNGDRTITALLQDHCHVRLMRPDRTPVSLPNLERGDEILGHVTTAPQPEVPGPTEGVERRDL